MPDFRQALASGRFIIFDGGFGSLLQARGMPAGVSPEAFGMANPEVVASIHADYARAGAQVVTTNTFGGTRYKLPDSLTALEVGRTMARTARQAVGDSVFVAGSVGPTGHFVRPVGDVAFRELVDAFKEQIEGLVQGGADLILVETQFDLAEARAAVVAARLASTLPVAVTMTFEGDSSLTGTPPLTFLDTMQNLGVEVLGTNCGAGPEQMIHVLEAMLPRAVTPILVQPNAGLPRLENGRTVFPQGPGEFARATARIAAQGARCVGGCCGSTPDHIQALARELSGLVPSLETPARVPDMVLTSRTMSVAIGPDEPVVVIGERINPTGKKDLTAELQAGSFARATRLAQEQIERGARILDVNVGAPMVDEKTLLPELVTELFSRYPVPLCLDSSDAEAMTLTLDAYPASPLVNSISGEPGRMERLGPLCRLLGAPFILLPLKGKKLPVSAVERITIIEELVAQALSLGIPKRLIMVDALALTISSKPEAAKSCLAVIRHCRETLGLPTTLGLSNISFGLPARELINTNFLAMAAASGLSACIANPDSARLRQTLAAAETLLDRDPQAASFIAGYAEWRPDGQAGGQAGGTGPGSGATGPRPGTAGGSGVATPGQAVVAGARDVILSLVEAALANGAKPSELLNSELIPAIMRVGELYERKEYFLPQLIRSAETMRAAFERLAPLLEEDGGSEARPRLVLATVEGDIHDIGKNIVALMMKNHGFEVLDLGKDVPAERIVDEAKRVDADLIGLSALMTTTMVRMRDTVDLARQAGLRAKIFVGGAVVTDAFAQAIGADGYAADAVEAVRLASRLLGRQTATTA